MVIEKNIEIPSNIKPLWLLLFVLIAVLMLIQQVGAYVYRDYTDIVADWTLPSQFSYTTNLYGDTTNYKDIYFYQYYYGASSGNNLIHKISYPTTYWAFTCYYTPLWESADWIDIGWLDSGDAGIISARAITSPGTMVRIEAVRTSHSGSPHFHIYRNGALVGETATASTIPYKVYFYFRTTYAGYFQFGDIVIGDTEEKNVVSTIPDTWFVAKDVFNSAFTGLYSATDTQVYTDKMHCTYATDDGSGTVKVAHVGTGTVVNTTTVSSYAGVITYNLTTMLFNSGAPYGKYRVYIDGSTAEDYFWYKAIATSGTSIQWDKSQYAKGETATVTFSIAEPNWDTELYTYRIEIWDENTEQKTSTLITSRPVGATKTYSIDVGTTFPQTGTYYAVLTATDKSSGTEYLLVYDDAYIMLPGSGEVWVQGETYDATTNSTLSSCTVTATQLGVDQTTTSNATGWYEITTGLVTDWSLGVNASKSGYVGYKMDFTPVIEGVYRVDVPLVPAGGPEPGYSSNATTAYYNSSVDGTAIGGLCWQGPYWTLSEGCNITITGDGWETSCTTGAGGWYQCNNLPSGGPCTLSCSKAGYTTYTKSCTLASGCFNREDCTIEKTSTLTVYCRDLGGSLITGTEVSLELDTGQSTTTTTGVATFTGLQYGSYTVTADAIGYYPGSTSVIMDQDKTVTVYLQKEGERGAGISYAPKSVEFTVQTIWGKAIQDCQVNCTGYETTVGPWGWVYQLFGIEENGTPIATSTMGGYTDYKGQINFLMLEPVKYECLFYKPGEINKNLTVYPKSDHYLILATEFGNASWYQGGSDINAMINCTVRTSDGPTSKDRNITVTYTDLTGGTLGGIVYLNQTNTTPGGAEICLSSWSDLTNNCTHTFTVTNCAGQSYFVRVRPTHSTWEFQRDFSVSFPPEQVNPLGLTDTELALMSCFLILFVGLLFGGISAPHAPLVMSFLGWIFLALGWLNAIITTAVPALLLASVLSVAYLIMVRSKKERWV